MTGPRTCIRSSQTSQLCRDPPGNPGACSASRVREECRTISASGRLGGSEEYPLTLPFNTDAHYNRDIIGHGNAENIGHSVEVHVPLLMRACIDVIPSGLHRCRRTKYRPHPLLKPQAFMRQIVRASLPLGSGIVLDPFMGAGSTIAAAVAVGYASVGDEVDPGGNCVFRDGRGSYSRSFFRSRKQHKPFVSQRWCYKLERKRRDGRWPYRPFSACYPLRYHA